MGIKLLIFVLLALFNLFILNTIHAKEPEDGRRDNREINRDNRGEGAKVNVPQEALKSIDRNSRSSPYIQRTPSMSRTINQNTSTRNSSRPRIGGQSNARNQVNQFIKNNPTYHLPNSTYGQNYRAGVNTRDNSNWNRVAVSIRGQINNRYPNKGNWFNQNFFESHRYQPVYHNYKGNLWKGATVVDINHWFNLKNQPYYYYGTDGTTAPNSYDNSSNIYIEPTVLTTEVVNSSDESTGNWMSLGVFTITKSTESITSPNMFIQLAVSKSGDIAGTYYNTTTNEVYELVGGVEQQSQRAFWKIADNPESPFVETGIYNLTQDVTPIKVYYQNGEVKDLLLIRVEG